MKKIKLDDYKKYYTYYSMFNSYIKENKIKKQVMFDRLEISFASYMRCSKNDTSTTKKIYLKLCREFGIIALDIKTNNLIEERLNEIFYNLYYKIDRDYEEDINFLDEYIKQKYTIFPILILFKAFIFLNIKPPCNLLKEYGHLFEKVKTYKDFFLYQFKEIYYLIEAGFERNTQSISKNVCENDLLSQMLASLYFIKGEYNTALNYALKAENDFVNSKNFIRVVMVDLVIMGCYNSCQNFKQAYILARKCKYALKGFNKFLTELDFVNFHLMISLIGLGKYKEALAQLKCKKRYNINDCLAYILICEKCNIDVNWEEFSQKSNNYKNKQELFDDLKMVYEEKKYIDRFVKKYDASHMFIKLF